MIRAHSLLPALACLALALPVAAQQDVNLPDLGSSANAAISPQEADAYGASLLRALRAQDEVLDDPQVDAYLHALGYRLAAHSADTSQHYTFTALRDPEINAFAAPGGYIFVNSGLITTTASESELAAVIAHELAHISQHHLERAFEDAKKKEPLIALATLGALIAAGGSAGRGDVGTGIIASGIGLMQQEQLDFSRKDESEADHVGIETLAKAGFDPEAMADFFARMQRTLRPGGGDQSPYDVPPFLQTHPVTSERISDAKARAHVLEKQMRERIAPDSTPTAALVPGLPFVRNPQALLAVARGSAESGDYDLIRERVRVLAGGDLTDTLDYYANNLARDPSFATRAHKYGYALALVRAGKAAQAVGLLRPLLAARPDSTTLRLAYADAQLRAGVRDDALKIYAALSEVSPRNPAIALGYAQALLASGKAADAKLAQQQLKPLLNDDSEPELYRTYGHACHLAGDDVRAGEAYADATFIAGRPDDALGQLKRLSERKDLDYYARARIAARIAEITPIVLEMHRRHLPQEGDPDPNGGQLGFRACSGDSCL